MSIVILGTVIGSGVGNGSGVAVSGRVSVTLGGKTNIKKATGTIIDIRSRKPTSFDVYHFLPPLVASVGGLGGGLPGPSV